MKKNIIVAVAVLALLSSASFYGGMKYTSSSGAGNNSAAAYGAMRGQFAGGTQGRRSGAVRGVAGGGAVSGELIGQDTNSITVKLRDGGSKIVFLTTNIPITKSVSATFSELQTGLAVVAEGTSNPDGSLTARSLQIRPTPSTR